MSNRQRIPSSKPAIKRYITRAVKISWNKLFNDPRSAVNKSWDLGYVLQVLFFSILSGCRTSRDIETFSEIYDERIPDTTFDDIIVQIDPEPLRSVIAKQVKQALREGELPKQDFPVRITAIDGKCVSISNQSVGDFSQYNNNGTKEYYVNRVLRALHVSNSTKLFLGQREINGKSSETTQFLIFVQELLEFYGKTDLLEVFSVDAGMTSKANANYLIENGLGYVMALKGPQGVLLSNAQRLLADDQEPDFQTSENANGETVTRRFWRCEIPGQDKHGWVHAQEFWRIEQKTINNTTEKEELEERYFITSISADKLTIPQCMEAIRMHWGIENQGNWVFDTALAEDDAPICNRALVLVNLVRLHAYNIISLLKNRRLRKMEARRMSWSSIMHLVQAVLYELKSCLELKEFRCNAFV